MRKMCIFCLVLLTSLNSQAETSEIIFSKIDQSSVDQISTNDLRLKFNNSDNPLEGGYNDLVPFIVPAPYQGNAGSCLYMSHTGIVEWWLNKIDNNSSDYKIDLSERYFMALKTEQIGTENVKNWRTDNIERLNTNGKMYLNDDYRFTKGNYKVVDGTRLSTTADDKDSNYGVRYNWISFKGTLPTDKAITLPKFKRNLILVDKDENQWNVAKAPLDIADQVKNALVENQAPVLVIYNHQGFWHATIVFGFNDTYPTKNCPFTTGFQPHMNKRALEIEEEALSAETDKIKAKLLRKAKKFRQRGTTVQNRFEEIGGCSAKGVFYVRDSIFPNESMPLYDYDLTKTGEEEFLNQGLIVREYEWLTTTANHIIQILPKK